MHFEPWMMIITGIFWLISMVAYGRASFQSGVLSLLNYLSDEGYIEITEDDEVVGLCNQNRTQPSKKDT